MYLNRQYHKYTYETHTCDIKVLVAFLASVEGWHAFLFCIISGFPLPLPLPLPLNTYDHWRRDPPFGLSLSQRSFLCHHSYGIFSFFRCTVLPSVLFSWTPPTHSTLREVPPSLPWMPSILFRGFTTPKLLLMIIPVACPKNGSFIALGGQLSPSLSQCLDFSLCMDCLLPRLANMI